MWSMTEEQYNAIMKSIEASFWCLLLAIFIGDAIIIIFGSK